MAQRADKFARSKRAKRMSPKEYSKEWSRQANLDQRSPRRRGRSRN